MSPELLIINNSHRYISTCICKNWYDFNQLRKHYYDLIEWVFFLQDLYIQVSEWNNSNSAHCVKNVQIRSFFCSVFSRIQTEYGEIRSICPYSVRMWKNTDQKKLRIWTHFTQWRLLKY